MKRLRAALVRWLAPATEKKIGLPPREVEMPGEKNDDGNIPTFTATLYDENLYDRARTQWQFGDWESLARLEPEILHHHPDRAKLALLAASGHMQSGRQEKTRQLLRLAQEWGCGKKLIAQIMVASVHNSLGRAAAISRQETRAFKHFESSLNSGTPGSEARLLIQARMSEQFAQLEDVRAKGVNQLPLSTQEVKNTDKSIKASMGEFPGRIKARQIDASGNYQSRPKDVEKKVKFSSDANIDEFIADIAPFFFNKHITYVDVGAYIGEVLLKIIDSKKIKIREAHLIEPNPDSYVKLKSAIDKIKNTSFHVYNFAIGTESGKWFFMAAESMTKRISPIFNVSKSSNVFEAECYKLDDIAAAFTDNRVDLLKLDVEGEEMAVLAGASDLLEKQRIDVIYVEVGLNKEGTQQTYFGEIDNQLQKLGYRVFKIYEQKNEWISDSPLLRRCNAAYMSKRFSEANPYSLINDNYLFQQELELLKNNRNN